MNILSSILILTSILSILLNYKNYILILLSLELLFIAISLLFFDVAFQLDDFNGIITAIFILCISATESALGLTILMLKARKINNPIGIQNL